MFDALVIDRRDNVATALRALEPGSATSNRGEIYVKTAIPRGHKVALADLSVGDKVVKYGEAVGVVTQELRSGEHVHVHNVGDLLSKAKGASQRAKAGGVSQTLLSGVPSVGPWDIDELRKRTFMGYPRPDGQVGIRNYVLVISTVGRANVVAERIAAKEDVPVITHQQGDSQLGTDMALTKKQLLGAAMNPNVGAVLFVSSGHELMQPSFFLDKMRGKPVAVVGIQSSGGTRSTIDEGVAAVQSLKKQVEGLERRPFPISRLIVGTKCGGSDAFSGLTANPATGVAADMVVDAGGAVLLSETPGLFGSEPHLAARMRNQTDRDALSVALDLVWEESLRLGEPMSEGEMAPGNIEGGLTTLIEKSLGATTKAGTRPIEGFLPLADSIPGPGLWIMDTPGYDILTISAQAAGGAHLILFTTGSGSPEGCAIAPVINICTNSQTFNHMSEDMDINAGVILDAEVTLEEVGAKIFDLIIAVANGEEAASEFLGHGEFALTRIGSTL